MSTINLYKHELIGVCKNDIWLYRLLQDIPEKETDFDGKTGYLLLGGGGGESSSIRIDTEALIKWLTDDNYVYKTKRTLWDDIIKAYWSISEAYIYGKEYTEMGWDYNECSLETWLGEHIATFLIKNYCNDYKHMIGKDIGAIDYDGSIFRLPDEEEKEMCTCISEIK